MKSWYIEFKSACKAIYCHKLSAWGGIKCEDYKLSVICASCFLFFLLIGGGLGSGIELFQYGMSFMEDRDKNATSVVESVDMTSSVIQSDGPQINRYITKNEENENGCKLTEGTWNLWLGEMSRDVKDPGYLFLPSGSNQGLFKYSQVYNPEWACEFVFVPRGKDDVNYVISFDGIYQIVIGDNDFWTISLRASDALDGPLKPKKESLTQLERPRLQSKIRPGSTVKVLLEQKFINDKEYEVKVTVDYDRDVSYEIDSVPESFSWIFEPSPSFDLRPLELSIGLIRGLKDSTVGASFLSPNPDIKLQSQDE